tara:strand:- start:199 stop:558 length:360 start_codon:yes stop_codon:yes gene_type:complete
MKKLLVIAVLGLLWSGNTLITSDLRAHSEKKHAFLVCGTGWSKTYIEINHSKKEIIKENVVYRIYKTEPTFVYAQKDRFSNRRIVIHRYLNLVARQQKMPDGSWQTTDELKCEQKKQNF